MRLAKEGVASGESNAGYYIAGASLVGAAAVAFLVMRKQSVKANERPLLAVDDELECKL